MASPLNSLVIGVSCGSRIKCSLTEIVAPNLGMKSMMMTLLPLKGARRTGKVGFNGLNVGMAIAFFIAMAKVRY